MSESIINQTESITQIKYINPQDAVFEKTEGGFLSLKINNDKHYQRINLYRTFPFSHANEYISVRDTSGTEIGIIKDLKEFQKDSAALIEEQLNRRYFAPVINKITSIKEEFGYFYWDAATDSGDCRFTVQGRHNVISLNSNRILIIDVDGNRFDIPDYKKLDEKSIKKLETFI